MAVPSSIGLHIGPSKAEIFDHVRQMVGIPEV